MNIFLISLFLIIVVFFLSKYINNSKKIKNLKINKFKQKLMSKDSNIQKIFLRDDEKTFSNPNININIGIYEKENIIKRKSNIHRARLSKFKKSNLNGETIHVDEQERIFKYVNRKKIYL